MFEIMCKERFKEAMELSREHRDQTFSNCMMRLLSYLTWNNADKVRLTRDWDVESVGSPYFDPHPAFGLAMDCVKLRVYPNEADTRGNN